MKLRAMGAVVGICTMAFGLSAPAAFASQGHGATSVTAVTHANDHPDTSTLPSNCTVPSSGGAVWAYDNLTFRFRVTPQGTGTYTVMITASGSFHAFASRFTATTCTDHQSGSVRGYVNYEVQSTTPPDRANLPAQEPTTMTQSKMVKLLFQTATTSVSIATGSRGYDYTYTSLTGMQCTTASTTGFTCS